MGKMRESHAFTSTVGGVRGPADVRQRRRHQLGHRILSLQNGPLPATVTTLTACSAAGARICTAAYHTGTMLSSRYQLILDTTCRAWRKAKELVVARQNDCTSGLFAIRTGRVMSILVSMMICYRYHTSEAGGVCVRVCPISFSAALTPFTHPGKEKTVRSCWSTC